MQEEGDWRPRVLGMWAPCPGVGLGFRATAGVGGGRAECLPQSLTGLGLVLPSVSLFLFFFVVLDAFYLPRYYNHYVVLNIIGFFPALLKKVNLCSIIY